MHQTSVAKKPTAIDWIGDIPVNWELKRLKYVATLAYGDSLSAERRTDGEIGVYGSNGVVGANDKANTLGKTIIIGRKGSFGKLNLSEESVFAIDTTYFIDRRFTNENIDWLYYLLCCLKLDSFSKDSAVPGLAREDVYVRWCPVPPKREQEAIVSFLKREVARIDALVLKRKRLIELLGEKLVALTIQAVTKGINPSVQMKDSGEPMLGPVPIDWDVAPLRRILDCSSGDFIGTNDFELDGTEHCSIPVVGGNGVLGFTNRANSPPGTLIIGRVGALCGNIHLVNGPCWVTDNALKVAWRKPVYLSGSTFFDGTSSELFEALPTSASRKL